MAGVKTLVVDDFEPFRSLVCTLLQPKPELQIVGLAADGREAVDKAEELQPDLILLDIGLPNLNGIEVAEKVRKGAPNAKILFVSQESSSDVVKEALRFGTGYVLKTHCQTELLLAIELVLRGEHFFGSGLEFSDGDHPSVALYQRLRQIIAQLRRIAKLPELLYGILDAAIELSEADFGNLQMLNRRTGELKMLAHRGFGPAFVQFFESVRNDNSCCRTALKTRSRVVVEDVSVDPIYTVEARTIMLNAGARACQSTPLFTPNGEPVGILSTHYRRRHRPSESTLQLLDLIAQKAVEHIQRFISVHD